MVLHFDEEANISDLTLSFLQLAKLPYRSLGQKIYRFTERFLEKHRSYMVDHVLDHLKIRIAQGSASIEEIARIIKAALRLGILDK